MTFSTVGAIIVSVPSIIAPSTEVSSFLLGTCTAYISEMESLGIVVSAGAENAFEDSIPSEFSFSNFF